MLTRLPDRYGVAQAYESLLYTPPSQALISREPLESRHKSMDSHAIFQQAGKRQPLGYSSAARTSASSYLNTTIHVLWASLLYWIVPFS